MARHLADFRQRRPLVQHVDGKSMTNLMRPVTSRVIPARLIARRCRCSLQTVERLTRAQEHLSAGRLRSPVFQIGRDRFAKVMRQRQRSLLAAFAMYTRASFWPVDILQFQANDFSGAHPRRAGSNRTARLRSPTGERQVLLSFKSRRTQAAGIVLWDRPSSDAGDSRGKTCLDVVAIPCKTEERTEP